ncbi:MAG: hypothetical protein HKN69_09315 [Desulfofustis sp.]|nr:hypothetical protein [Desulfofustis sp.]
MHLRVSLSGLLLLFLCGHSVADNSIDISFNAPLFCDNSRKSIVYAMVSSNKNSFTKITQLAYFTDGYKNTPASNFYTSSQYKVNEDGQIGILLSMMVGEDVYNYSPQKSGEKSLCSIRPKKGWRKELLRHETVSIYESGDFEAFCNFSSQLGMCKTSKELAAKLYIPNPYGGPKILFESKFIFKEFR